MSGLVVGGKVVAVPGLDVRSWKDEPTLRLSDGDRRDRKTGWVRNGLLHFSQGVDRYVIKPGAGPRGGAERMVENYNRDPDHNGAHGCIDYDGSFAQFADFLSEVTYHGRSINEVSFGIEVKQTAAGVVYQAQLVTLVLLVDALTAILGIQRQLQAPYRRGRPVPRLAAGGEDCVGVFGHRDQTDRRGPGDPANEVFAALVAAGYEARDFAAHDDKVVWRRRQAMLGMAGRDVDGIPGPGTRAALEAAGHRHGQWVPRPVDELLAL